MLKNERIKKNDSKDDDNCKQLMSIFKIPEEKYLEVLQFCCKSKSKDIDTLTNKYLDLQYGGTKKE
jgi:hypothetical protein